MDGKKIRDANPPGRSMLDQILYISLNITRIFLFPSFLIANEMLINYFPTLEDRKYGEMLLITKALYTLGYLCLMALTLPLIAVFFPLRILLLSVRKPYRHSIHHTEFNRPNEPGPTTSKRNTAGCMDFSIASMNILLLPEYAARSNNIKDVKWRSEEIGRRIINDQIFPHNQSNSSNHGETGLRKEILTGTDKEVQGKFHTHFSHLDFICIQEAFSNYHVKSLKKELHKTFPYIVYDVGVHSYKVNKFVYNSGLMIASRHSIAAIDFKPFTDFMWPGTVMSKGMLMVKVIVGSDSLGGLEYQRVGYIFNVHLQVYHEHTGIVIKQLNEVLKWSDEFMLRTKNPGDQVLFSILCGDFNSDNLSQGDCENANHECFKVFTDYGRVAPGVEKEWTVGTELRFKNMSDPFISTPEGLKRAIEDPLLRQQYIGDSSIIVSIPKYFMYEDPPRDENGIILPSSIGGKRRVDLITFHSNYPVIMKKYDFVTRLASLTDHIPVQVSFSCNLSKTKEANSTNKGFDKDE